jgi:hypothetical protein
MYATQWRYEATIGGNPSLRQAEFWERRLTSVQRRYLRAIETLARVRKVAPKALMVNVAQQQINAAI